MENGYFLAKLLISIFTQIVPMTEAQIILEELTHEAMGTQRILRLIPEDKLGWLPHEKSMTLGRLAAHIAELPSWLTHILTKPELDLAMLDYTPVPMEEPGGLISVFDDNMNKGVHALQGVTNEFLNQGWTLRNGNEVIFKMARAGVIRGMVLNHIVHHRGQLTVYLRLLNLPVPGMYGPSADEMMG